jgi:hypothetical protein
VAVGAVEEAVVLLGLSDGQSRAEDWLSTGVAGALEGAFAGGVDQDVVWVVGRGIEAEIAVLVMKGRGEPERLAGVVGVAGSLPAAGFG